MDQTLLQLYLFNPPFFDLTKTICNDKSIIFELLSKLNFPIIFYWIAKLYADTVQSYL